MKDAGYYQVVATNSNGSAVSPVIFVNIVVESAQVIGWGDNFSGQTEPPPGLNRLVSIAAGAGHGLALKNDGTIMGWGRNDFGQAVAPVGLSDVVSIAAGNLHSVALKGDGTVVAWGWNDDGQTTVPAGLTKVVAIAAGGRHSLALKDDGAVVIWGNNRLDPFAIPSDLSNVVALAGGTGFSLALKSDGTVVAWGYDNYGQVNVPVGLSNVSGIAAGAYHSYVLKSDGTVVVWGRNDEGEALIPPSLSDIVSISSGDLFNLALKSDGTVAAWGSNELGQTTIPVGLSQVVAVAAGGSTSLALRGGPAVQPSITTQPNSQSVLAATDVSFTVVASGSPAPSYQWQLSTDNGSTWANLIEGAPYSGTTSSVLTITGATTDLSGFSHRCIATNVVGTATTNVVTLTVNPVIAPSFTTQPLSQTVVPGGSGTFTVVVAGSPSSLQWHESTDNGSTWLVLPNGGFFSGVTSAALTITGTLPVFNNYLFRCVATNAAGSAISASATLKVNAPPAFTTQPANQTALTIGFAGFIAVANGSPTPAYQWQLKKINTTTWTNVVNGGVYSGATDSDLAITAPPTTLNGYQYRCVATNSFGSAISAAATLTVNPTVVPFFTTQPSNQTIVAGQNASFTAIASGTPAPSYNWEVRTSSNSPWTNVVFSSLPVYSGTSTDTLTITAPPVSFNGYQYRCVATSFAGTTYSTGRTLTIVAPPVFTTQPNSQIVTAGLSVSFTVTVSGTPTPTYQWQLSANGGGTWGNIANGAPYSGAKTATLNVTNPASGLNSFQYRCVATNTAGTATSTVATLTVLTNSKFSLSTASVTASTHDGNVPSNTVDGNLSTRWSAQGDGQWIKFDLGTGKRVAFVKIACYSGSTRTCYFDLQGSSDNVTFTTLSANVNSAQNANLQTFDFTDANAVRYLRILGHGNSENNWNSYTEVEVWGGSAP